MVVRWANTRKTTFAQGHAQIVRDRNNWNVRMKTDASSEECWWSLKVEHSKNKTVEKEKRKIHNCSEMGKHKTYHLHGNLLRSVRNKNKGVNEKGLKVEKCDLQLLRNLEFLWEGEETEKRPHFLDTETDFKNLWHSSKYWPGTRFRDQEYEQMI